MSTMCETCGQLVVNTLTPCESSLTEPSESNKPSELIEKPCENSTNEEGIDGFAPSLRILIEKLPLSVRARLTAKLAHLNIDKGIDSPAVRGVVEFAVQAYDKKRALALSP